MATGSIDSAVTVTEPLIIPNMRLPEFVLEDARSRGAKLALIEADSGREISYARLADAVSAAAEWFAGMGVRPGDVVALCAPGSIEFVITLYAASRIGAVVTTVNPVVTSEEIVSQFQRTSARWLVTTGDLFAVKLAAVARQVRGLVETFVLGTDVPAAVGVRARGLDILGLSAPESAGMLVPSGLSPDDVAFLTSSSGTTGRPKIVMLTHRNMVASVCMTDYALAVTERDVTITLGPMFHIYGLQVGVNEPLLRGATIVVLPEFEFGAFLRAIQDYRVTRADIVPPVAVLLAKSELVDEFDLSSLRLMMSAAAPLSLDVARACAGRLGVRLFQSFGLTEVAGGTHIGSKDGLDRPDSVGPPLPGMECRVIDPGTGQDLGVGEPGELLVRAPSMMRGYLGDPAATAAVIDADGWLHTGDVVTVDADGWYRVTDRIKELIKCQGRQVAPAELEDVLLAHPAVADAAVVRSPDESAGEVPKAFVVRKPGAAVGAQELMAWVAERVAPFSRVRRVEFTDAIPKTAAGKILRRLLVEREYQDMSITGQAARVDSSPRKDEHDA
jgi:acyl-CoA synthetase (AMP-forming)/AMP-acid ligase II